MLKISNLRIPEELAQTLASSTALLSKIKDRIDQKYTGDVAVMIAGGICRDAYAYHLGRGELPVGYAPGSGDIDIVIVGLGGAMQEAYELVQDLFEVHGDTCCASFNPRMDYVVQGSYEGIEVDVLFYNDQYPTLLSALGSFNTTANGFYIMPTMPHQEPHIQNHNFDPLVAFDYNWQTVSKDGGNEEEMKESERLRHLKSKARYEAMAHAAKVQTGNPYAMIRG